MKPYSVTRLQNFGPPYGCPRKWAKIYREGKRDQLRSTPLTRVGQAVHGALCRYQDYCRRTGERQALTVAEYHAREATALAGLPPEEADDCLALVRRWANERNLVFAGETHFECWVGANISPPAISVSDTEEPQNCDFRIRFDRVEIIENDVWITDFKAGWKVVADLETDLQARAAIWAASRAWPDREYHFRREHIRYMKTSIYPLAITPEVVAEIEADLVARMRAIDEEKEFAPRPSEACLSCEFVADCPAREDAGDDPATLCKCLAHLEGELKAIREQLQAITAESGPLELGGRVLGWHEQGAGYFGPEVFEALGVEIKPAELAKHFIPTVAAVKKMLRSDKQLLEQVLDLVQYEAKTVFGWRKKPEPQPKRKPDFLGGAEGLATEGGEQHEVSG